ncbi:unnamed protein product [Aphanomyces euteiches]|uniref:AB hydrolase-1 domain-containing protein n=1 Tax=Aphanomyces euteiches TaxID=100861 RepID=A0A6G0XT02_9STRA|nr:hypothetical protein Ae201684_001709 [Aphanomyces euteiches]KAH9075511.1 hypothetical protein Ae201684P_004189 [Aphanomyces euteiches]KAH9156100.1 hypothetical protein AeRB84_001959 [Aphanomyces euteiches]
MARTPRHVHIEVGTRRLLGLLASAPSSPSSSSIVLYFHGFPDLSVHPDTSAPPDFASRMPRKLQELLPYDLLCVNFSGLPGSDDVVPYRSKLLSRELEDADGMIAYCEHALQKQHVHVVGLSTGAILATLLRNHTQHKSLRSIAVIAGIADTAAGIHLDFSQDQLDAAQVHGYCMTPFFWPTDWPLPADATDFDASSGKLFRPLDAAYLDDMKSLDIATSVRDGPIPLLVIHGDQDKNVPLRHGETLFQSAREPKQWLLLKGANHLLSNSKHIKRAAADIQRHIHQSETDM